MKWITEKGWLFVLVASMVGVGLLFFLYHQTKEQKETIQRLESRLVQLKNEKESLYQEAEELESRYKALYQEKNGTAEEGLLGSVQTLFEQLYQYDTGNPNYGVGERRKAAQAVASASVLSQLFPEDVRPSVQTLSKLDAVETYIRSSDKERVEALVLVRFSTSIAGSQEIKGSYLYKVSYSWSEQLLVSVIPLGNATFLTE